MAQGFVGCWQAAFARLSPDTREALNSLQKSGHTPVNSSHEIDNIITLSKAKQAECKAKEWIVKMGSRKVNVRLAFSRMIDWLDKFKIFGDMAMNVDPVHAAIPWAAFRFVLEAFKAERDQMGYIAIIMEEAARQVHHGRVFEDLYLGPRAQVYGPINQELLDDLRSDIIELYISILDGLSYCCSQIQKHSILRVGDALLKPEDAKIASVQLQDRWEKLREQAQKCDGLRLLQISDEIRKQFPDIFSALDKILIKMESKERIQTLQTISSVPYRGHHIDIQERRTNGTGQWILETEEFQLWKAPESSIITLLYGAPGAGKTLLTSRVIDHVEKIPGLEGFAYFYCKRDEEERRQPASILGSLVRQLASPFQQPQEIHQEVQALATNLKEQALTLSSKMCQKILLKLIASYKNTTIILDALDECDLDKRSQLMDCLSLLMSQQLKIKIFISSRKDADIIRHFESQPVIEIQATNNQHDIESFLKHELTQDKRWESLGPKLKEKIISTLFQVSQGMFQWAALQVQHLAQLTSWNEDFIEDRLGRLPRTLEKSYEEIWQKILLKGGIESRLAKRAICWVLCADPPLNTKQLSTAIMVDNSNNGRLFDCTETVTEEDIRSLCCNLLMLEKGQRKWRFCHLSAIEYVETRLFDQLQPYKNTASACIKYLLSIRDCDLQREITYGLGYYVCINYDYDLFGEITYGLDNYVCINWPNFVKRKENIPEKWCLPLLRFLGSAELYGKTYRISPSQKFKLARIRERNAMSVYLSLYTDVVTIFSSAVSTISFFGLAWVLKDLCETNHDLNLDACPFSGLSPLGLAATQGHEDLCRFLIHKGANLQGTFPDPLMLACKFHQESVIQVLVESGAEVNMLYKFSDGMFGTGSLSTPLQAAIGSTSDAIVVRLLQDYRADVNLKDNGGFTALNTAISLGKWNIASILLQYGAKFGDVNAALMDTTRFNMVDWIEKCINAGADVNTYDGSGSALMCASEGNCLDAAKRLVELGADVNMVVKRTDMRSMEMACPQTALASAILYDSVDVVELLLSEGANPNIHTSEMSPLIAAASNSTETCGCLATLLNAGANVNFVSKRSFPSTALVGAVFSRNAYKVRYLLDAGADPNLGNDSNCPLTALVFPNMLHYSPIPNKTILQLLLNAGVNPNHNNGFSNFLCTMARDLIVHQRGRVRWLNVWQSAINLGADPTNTFKEGPGSALACAAFWGNTWACQFLLSPKLGVDPNAQLHGSFENALLAAIGGKVYRATRKRRERRKLRRPKPDLDVVQILIKSGADIPKPMYRALAPGIPRLQIWGESCETADATLGIRMYKRRVTWCCIPQAWVLIMWEISSGPAPRLPFGREIRKCGFPSSLPPSILIIMKFSSSSKPAISSCVALYIFRSRSDLFIYNEDKSRFEPLWNAQLSNSMSTASPLMTCRRGPIPLGGNLLPKYLSYSHIFRKIQP